jgi:hypothetical protein
MGKRLSKEALLAEIEIERSKLDRLLSDLTLEQMTEPGVTPGGWSMKDILAHLIGWQRMNLSWYMAGERGEEPEVPGYGLTWRETPKLNSIIYGEHRGRPLKEVLDEFKSSHEKMLDLIGTVTDSDLVAIGRYRWAGPSWTLSDYIRANTASHYRWASNHIKKWMHSQKKTR